MRKIIAVSSKGGHFSELMNISETLANYNTIYISEKSVNHELIKYKMFEGTRSNLFRFMIVFSKNLFLAFKILKIEKPDLIISTGAHTCVPFFILAKFFKAKTIYIESFAKVSSKSLTYKIINKLCDITIVQHKSMLDVYPEAIYFGGVY